MHDGQNLAAIDARSLARALLAETGGPGTAALAVASAAIIAEAIVGFEAERPLIDEDAKLVGKWADTTRDCFRIIGGSCWPRMEQRAKTVWIQSTMLKLATNLPGRVLASAARKAIERSYCFENEVEPVIREHAATIQKRNAWALRRLQLRMAEIERAAQAQPLLESEAEELTVPEIAKLINGGDEFGVLRMGINAGWITEEQLAAARAL